MTEEKINTIHLSDDTLSYIRTVLSSEKGRYEAFIELGLNPASEPKAKVAIAHLEEVLEQLGWDKEKLLGYLDGLNKTQEDTPYPITLITTRYGGTYEGGLWAAFHEYPHNIPEGATDSDIECAEFWTDNKIRIGVGQTPVLAVEDLKLKLEANDFPRNDKTWGLHYT